MYAIVDIAGQQFKVEEGNKIFIHRLDKMEGDKVDINEVLLIGQDGKVVIGQPLIKGASVTAKVIDHPRGDKVKVFKKKRRKGYQILNGHRQDFTQIQIESILEKGAEKKTVTKSEEKPKPKAEVEKKVEVTTTKKPVAKKAPASTVKSTEANASKKPVAKSTATKKTVAKTSATTKKAVAKKAPARFFDVGIAEQHAVTFACALAANGLKPFVSIYSTFLQRAVDQIIHDVGIMNLPVRLLIDRAGIVGEDGETHHGLFDICIIKNIPNFIFLAPSNCIELRDMLYFAQKYDKGPLAIRYPRGGDILDEFNYDEFNEFVPGKSKRLTNGTDIAIFSLGDMTKIAVDLHKLLEKEGVKSSVVNLLSIKPLDLNGIQRVIKKTPCFITMENGCISGGVGESILSEIDADLRGKLLFTVGFPDEFIIHGASGDLYKEYGMDAESLCKRIIEKMKRMNLDEKGDKIRRLSVKKRA